MNRHKKSGCLTSFIALCLFVLLAGYVWWSSNYTIEKEDLIVTSSRLPAAFNGFRVVEIADLHGREFENDLLLQAVKDSNPNIITLNGDISDDESQFEYIKELASALCEIAPTFYVTGNHEWSLPNIRAFLELLESCGVQVLQNEYATLTMGDDIIILAGVDDPCGPYDMTTPDELVEQIRIEYGENAYILMLAHRNEQLLMWAELEADTVLVGHGHGGIIRIPFVGGLISTDRSLFPEYTYGIFVEGRTSMVVSRGLGNSVVNFRILNPPHLPTIVLKTK